MTGPFDGLRVLDFSHVIAGPFCTRLLADMGANVVRVEQRHGDLMRQLPVAFDGDLSSAFAQYNCGKSSLCMDLKTEWGRDVALRLVAWADVVVENFRPGVLDDLGLSYEVMREHRPDVILCSLSTFGASGPYAELSGFGMVAEAYSGLMSLTGEEGGPPMHFGTPLADMTSGVHAVAAIGAALFHRGRTGIGAHVDISAFDGLFAMIDQAPTLGSFTGGTRRMGRYGRRHATTVPSGVAAAADGRYVSYGVAGDTLFGNLVEAMGEPELAADERFATVEDRVSNAVALYERIDAWAARFPTADALVEHLTWAKVPAARVRTVEENLHDPHLVARGTLSPVSFADLGEVLVPTAPYRFSDAEVRPGKAAPHIGQDTTEVLLELAGLNEHEVTALLEKGIAHQHSSTNSKENNG